MYVKYLCIADNRPANFERVMYTPPTWTTRVRKFPRPYIIGGESLDNRFSTQQKEKLNKDKEGGNLQPSKTSGKRTTLGFV